MKFVYTFVFALLFTSISFSQTITEIYVPQYVQATGTTNSARVPYVCRLKISGLMPDSTYRYYCRFVPNNANSTNGGEGNFYYINQSGNFDRITGPSVGSLTACALLKADASGEYTGWFSTEVGTTSTIFGAGRKLKFRIFLNNGISNGSNIGLSVSTRPTTTSEVTIINWGLTATNGKAIRSTAVTGGVAKNFVLLWDNVAIGTNRPISGTFIESDGEDASNNYAPFYVNNVEGIDRAWGTAIPNNLANGIRRIGQYSLATGDEIAYKISSDGSWPVAGGGRKSTVNTSQLTQIADSCIVLDGALARLDGANIKTDQSITFNSIPDTTYGEPDYDPGAVSSAGLPVAYSSGNTAVADIVNNKLHITGVGTANITASQPGDDFYNVANAAMQPLTVKKALLTVTANDHQILQGDPIPALTITYSGFKYNDDPADLTTKPTATTAATQTSLAGQYEIIPDGGASPNYDFRYVKGLLTIVGAAQPQKLDFAPMAAKTYGHPDFDPGAIPQSGLPVVYTSSNTAVAETINGKIRIKGVGTTTITASQGGNSGWLAARDTSQQLVVTQATIRVTADNKRRKVGEPNPPLTVTATGFAYGETDAIFITPPVASTLADVSSPAGDYVISVSGATAQNYIINYVQGKLTIDPLLAQTITFATLPAKKYGDADIKLTATASSKLPVTFTSSNPAVAAIQNDSLRIITTGTTVITALHAGNTIYGPASSAQTLTIQKARLIIKADTLVKDEGEPVPALTFTYSGFVKNEDASVLTSLPVLTTIATANSIPGTYPISVSGAVAANYSIAQVGSILTVLPLHGAVQDNIAAYVNSPGRLQVNVFSVNAGKAVIQLFDGNGTRLTNVNVALTQGYNTFYVPVGNVAPGVYHVRAAVGGALLKTKVIIQ
jgi:hypothetical protein